MLNSSPKSSSHPTMDPSCAQGISNHVNSKFGWKQDKLVLSLGTDGNKEVQFDVVPYLGTEARQVLTFPNNSSMNKKQIIALFKEQASKQGVHLTTVPSSSNSESSKGCFFKFACNQFRAHNNDSNKYDWTSQQSTAPPPPSAVQPKHQTWNLAILQSNSWSHRKENAEEV
jgi:hypothetical protein